MNSANLGTNVKQVALVTGVMLGVWSFISGLLQGLLGFVDPSTFDASEALGPLPSLFLVSLLNAIIVTWVVNRTNLTGARLAFVIFTIVFGVMFFMTQIETIYFNSAIQMPSAIIISTILTGIVVGLVVSWLSARHAAKLALPQHSNFEPQVERDRTGEIVWKIAVLAAVYVVFYFVFGYFIAWQFPELREFYSGSRGILSFPDHMVQQLQTDPWLIVFQLFRGVLWAAMGFLVGIALTRASNSERMVIVGLALSVGLATLLLVPNPFMPGSVRLGHFFELLIENFIFGVLVALLFRSIFESSSRNRAA